MAPRVAQTNLAVADEIAELRCPLCQKPLASDEYARAKKELENRLSQGHEQKVAELQRQFQAQLEHLKKEHKEELERLQTNADGQLKKLEEGLNRAHKRQLESLEVNYRKISKDNQRQFDQLVRQLKSQHKEQLKAREKEIKELRSEHAKLRETMQKEADARADQKVSDMRTQLQLNEEERGRLQKKVEELQQQLIQKQPELAGEVGELDLYATLTEAFPGDTIRRKGSKQRGTEGADLVQIIKLPSGAPIDIPIAYDNKAAETVTKKDIEKAKKYRDIHGTNYSIIVCDNLPREYRNGYFGEKDGILLVHSKILVEVARVIRSSIIEIAKQSDSKRDRLAKEVKLYDYIKSQEFSRKLESLLSIYSRMARLQESEERAHQRLWKDRKGLQAEINSTYTDVSVGIQSILQESPPMQELVTGEGQKETQATTEGDSGDGKEQPRKVDIMVVLSKAKALVRAGKFKNVAEAMTAIKNGQA